MREEFLAYLQLLRLPAIFTTWSNILAAYLIASEGQIEWRTLGLLIGSSSALYLAGMVLNDCFDLDEDREERPQRPLPSGRIAVRKAWLLGWAMLLTGCLLAALVGQLQLLIALLLSAAILAYDGWLKGYALGSLAMGACRYLNWLLGLSVAPLVALNWALPLPILLYVASLTNLSRIETTARSTTPLSLCIGGIVATAGCILLLYPAGALINRWAIIPGGILLIALLYTLINSYRNLSAEKIQQNVKMMLLGIILLDALLVLAAGPWWGGLLLPLLLVPGRILARIIYIT